MEDEDEEDEEVSGMVSPGVHVTLVDQTDSVYPFLQMWMAAISDESIPKPWWESCDDCDKSVLPYRCRGLCQCGGKEKAPIDIQPHP